LLDPCPPPELASPAAGPLHLFAAPQPGGDYDYEHHQVAATVLLQSDKVEGLRVAASFMSEQSLLYLGLLGEYSCATRKRHKFLLHCMHQEPIRFPCSEVSFASAQSRLGFLERSAATLDSGLCHT